MIRFKNHFRKGFSFIEAIVALAVMAISITSLMVLQQSVFKRVAYNTFKVERLHFLQNMFSLVTVQRPTDDTKSQEKELLKVEKKYNDPETTVVYERLPIATDSTLSRFEGLYQERVTAQWMEAGTKRIADVYRYGFEIPEKKE